MFTCIYLHNCFEGSSPFAGSLSSPAFTYPPPSHIPSAFSLLDPHPLFPGAAFIPFGGLGSLGEGLMSSGVLGSTLASAGSKLYFYLKIFVHDSFYSSFVYLFKAYSKYCRQTGRGLFIF